MQCHNFAEIPYVHSTTFNFNRIFEFHISRPKLMSSYNPLLSVCVLEPSYCIRVMKEKSFSGLWNVSVFSNAAERSSSSHYRQKTFLSVISKPFEATINTKNFNHLNSNNLLSNKQYWFRSSRFTADAILLRIEIVKQLIIH